MPAPTTPKPSEDRHTITCLYCGKPQEVARRAMSITCKFCHKPLKLEDIAIKQYEARRQIATCGVVTVGPDAVKNRPPGMRPSVSVTMGPGSQQAKPQEQPVK